MKQTCKYVYFVNCCSFLPINRYKRLTTDCVTCLIMSVGIRAIFSSINNFKDAIVSGFFHKRYPLHNLKARNHEG